MSNNIIDLSTLQERLADLPETQTVEQTEGGGVSVVWMMITRKFKGESMYHQVAVIVGLVFVLCSGGVWSQGIQDIVFYDHFESGDTTGWWAPARVGETGVKTCFDDSGWATDCAGTGQDGDLQPGVAWPNPRFVDNSDGTVTDMLTGLLWLKDASCAELSGTDVDGKADLSTALTAAQALASGTCNLTDSSVAGNWHLPSVNELHSLIDWEYYSPALSNTAGTGQWTEGDVFTGVQSYPYWSSTPGWFVSTRSGGLGHGLPWAQYYLWPVRGGQ